MSKTIKGMALFFMLFFIYMAQLIGALPGKENEAIGLFLLFGLVYVIACIADGEDKE